MSVQDDIFRQVARARERFLEGTELSGPPAASVRDAVLSSWQRSNLYQTPVDQLDPPYSEPNPENKLTRAADAVLDRLEETLSGMAVSIVLTDVQARVLRRRAGVPSLNHHLDKILLAPGFSYAEKHVGTNGIGTALEERRSAHVFGSEHYNGRLQGFSCAGALIRNPLSGRIEGLLDLTCWRSDATPLMPALAQQSANDIEQRLVEQSTECERAMFAEFLAACRRSNKGILTVGDQLLIANATAASQLSPSDQMLLRETATELVGRSNDKETVSQVLLSQGQLAMLRCRPVGTGAGTVGAVCEISLQDEAPRRRAGGPAAQPAPPPGLAGRNAVFLKAYADVKEHCRERTWLLVDGETGVGKLAVVRAAHQHCRPDASLAVLDAAECAGDVDGWLDELRTRMACAGANVVLRHIDQLAPEAARRLAELLEPVAEQPQRPWVVGTARISHETGGEQDALLRYFPFTVTVPPLRHRIDDVRELVPALLRQLAPGLALSCGTAAMRTMLRCQWPENVAGLADALRSVLARRRVGEIGPQDLPERCHVTSRRVLTPWETMERDTIVRTLLEADGDKVRAASMLGISRATIYRKIDLYGVVVGS